MNIFATHNDPVRSAYALDDLRVNKMIVESAQMLSTALQRHGKKSSSLYRPCYNNHPCTLWAGNTRANFLWLCEHALALCIIYTMRSGKVHATTKVIRACLNFAEHIPAGKLEAFADCTMFKDAPTTVTNRYRLTMTAKWRDDVFEPTWTGRKPPTWSDYVHTGNAKSKVHRRQS